MKKLEENLSYNIGVLAHLLRNHHNQVLMSFDLSFSQAKVLYFLHEFGEQSQSSLQKRLYIQPSSMNGLVESMVKKNLIEKKESQLDRRTKLISLTEKGIETEGRLREVREEVETDLVSDFEPPERELLLSWLKKMTLRMQQRNGQNEKELK
ncbi:MarR family winged helix-turn-helix transcriptional regulator [Bacillus sp. FJAT-44742]|uniref:MarR family winged helix-turn-helix transcriptional regulator n=1 Tax=Bacillus sp. FJAT-44742 TaxID=2014005 RepID=UPI000C249F45|nr:MarR family transcriptional regulator [Bacillus sp. FJAT-44742]